MLLLSATTYKIIMNIMILIIYHLFILKNKRTIHLG